MIGWVLWGCVYAAGGLAVFVGLAALARRSPWLVVVAVLVVTGVIVAVVRWRRGRSESLPTEPQPHPSLTSQAR